MGEMGKYKYYEWDEADFSLPNEYVLDENSDLADALNVFYAVGGYDFFNVGFTENYAGNWLDFLGNLYAEIVDEKYRSCGKAFTVPLSDAQRQELGDRGVPTVFLTDI